jgi:hypothetical protein
MTASVADEEELLELIQGDPDDVLADNLDLLREIREETDRRRVRLVVSELIRRYEDDDGGS